MKAPANKLPDDITELKEIIAEQILSKQKIETQLNKYKRYKEEVNTYKEEVNTYKEEVNTYKEEVNIYRQEINRKEEELSKAQAYAERLEEAIRLLRHQKFGSKSEVVKREDKQLELGMFNEAEEAAETEAERESSIEVKGYKRRGSPKRIKLSADLPREEVVLDLAEDEKQCPEGHKLKCIGEEVSEQLDVIPAQIKVIRTIRKKYACVECQGHVKRAALPQRAIPKSIATAGLLANIATSKYGDGLPLYRQEHIWKRLGVEIPRSTMANWMLKVGELLTPLINLMQEDLMGSGYVQADETRVQVLKEPGKLATSLSYMWVRGRNYPGAPPIVLFEYASSRSGEVARELLSDYKGYLQTDAYQGYNSICSKEGVIRLGCWAHARRKFFEALQCSKKGHGLASEVIELIGNLYEIEENIKDASIEKRSLTRQDESGPILEELQSLLAEHLEKVPPKSQLGAALRYLHNEWPQLIGYLEDGRLQIDNNFIENAIRPFAVGRKNWLFSDSVAGAKASAAIYSVLVSAKLNGLNEYAYFRHVLKKLPMAANIKDYEALLPHHLRPQDITPVNN